MAERRRGLGKGIGALIPNSQKEAKDRPIDVFFGGNTGSKDKPKADSRIREDINRGKKPGKPKNTHVDAEGKDTSKTAHSDGDEKSSGSTSKSVKNSSTARKSGVKASRTKAIDASIEKTAVKDQKTVTASGTRDKKTSLTSQEDTSVSTMNLGQNDKLTKAPERKHLSSTLDEVEESAVGTARSDHEEEAGSGSSTRPDADDVVKSPVTEKLTNVDIAGIDDRSVEDSQNAPSAADDSKKETGNDDSGEGAEERQRPGAKEESQMTKRSNIKPFDQSDAVAFSEEPPGVAIASHVPETSVDTKIPVDVKTSVGVKTSSGNVRTFPEDRHGSQAETSDSNEDAKQNPVGHGSAESDDSDFSNENAVEVPSTSVDPIDADSSEHDMGRIPDSEGMSSEDMSGDQDHDVESIDEATSSSLPQREMAPLSEVSGEPANGSVELVDESVRLSDGSTAETDGSADGDTGAELSSNAIDFEEIANSEADAPTSAHAVPKYAETDEQVDTEEDEGLVAVPGATYAELPLSVIIPNTRQPRNVFDEDELAELADSIKEVGILQPIIVRPLDEPVPGNPDARYELIMGERRWRAAELAGEDAIPSIVRHTEDQDLLRDALLENLHRTQLNALEEAAAYQQLLEDFQCTQEELSRRIARSRPQISNTLRLLKLPPLVQRRVAAGVLSAGHARALLGLSDPGTMERIAQKIVAEGLSVRQVEELVALGDETTRPKTTRRRAKRFAPELGELSTRLADRFDTKVKVEMGAKRGSIKIDFASIEDLNRILEVLTPGEEGVDVIE